MHCYANMQAGIQIGRAEMLDDTMMQVLNKANGTRHTEATTVLFELAVRRRPNQDALKIKLTRHPQKCLKLELHRYCKIRAHTLRSAMVSYALKLASQFLIRRRKFPAGFSGARFFPRLLARRVDSVCDTCLSENTLRRAGPHSIRGLCPFLCTNRLVPLRCTHHLFICRCGNCSPTSSPRANLWRAWSTHSLPS